MSVYSGFATRAQETDYDSVLYNVLSLLSLRLLKFYKGENVEDQGFFKMLNSYQRNIRRMEKQKYMDPKYSPILTNLLTKLTGDDCLSEKSVSHKQFPRLDKTLSVNIETSTKYREREVSSQKTFPLQKIVERRVKKKRIKRKQKRHQTDEMSLWNLEPQRMPVIQRFKFASQQVSPELSRYNWATEMSKNVDMLKSGTINKVKIHQQNIKRITNGSRFRSKMYFK